MADIYIRFLKRPDGEWRLAGFDAVQTHFHAGRHSLDRSSGTPFLRIWFDGSHGSGLDSESEAWYDLSEPGFKQVFSVTAEGSRHAFGINRKTLVHATARESLIEVMLEVRFTGVDDNNGENDLGASAYHAIYTRPDATKPFRLQLVQAGFSPKSEISNSEFKKLADLDSDPSNEDLVRLDIQGLTAVATGKDSGAKNWLKEFLNRCKDTPEVRKLKALLR